jgi:hypothetical protein
MTNTSDVDTQTMKQSNIDFINSWAASWARRLLFWAPNTPALSAHMLDGN